MTSNEFYKIIVHCINSLIKVFQQSYICSITESLIYVITLLIMYELNTY